MHPVGARASEARHCAKGGSASAGCEELVGGVVEHPVGAGPRGRLPRLKGKERVGGEGGHPVGAV